MGYNPSVRGDAICLEDANAILHLADPTIANRPQLRPMLAPTSNSRSSQEDDSSFLNPIVPADVSLHLLEQRPRLLLLDLSEPCPHLPLLDLLEHYPHLPLP